MEKDIFGIAGRVVVITGGLGQLGRQFTKTLLDRGAKVAIFDLPPASNLADAYAKEYPGDIEYCSVDVSDKENIVSAMAAVQKKWGPPHGLINNAALDSPPNAPTEENGPFELYPEESWDAVMKINAKGVFLMCQVVGGAMAAAGRGAIINISSTYGLVSPDQRIYEYRKKDGVPFYKPVAYTASKSSYGPSVTCRSPVPSACISYKL